MAAGVERVGSNMGGARRFARSWSPRSAWAVLFKDEGMTEIDDAFEMITDADVVLSGLF